MLVRAFNANIALIDCGNTVKNAILPFWLDFINRWAESINSSERFFSVHLHWNWRLNSVCRYFKVMAVSALATIMKCVKANGS